MILAATGPRPPKIGGYSPHAQELIVQFAIQILKQLGPDKVISGFALGWDQAIAEAAITLGVPLQAYIPFTGQESRWPSPSQDHFNWLLDQVEAVIVVSEGGYAAWKMQRRNEAMVKAATDLAALWDGTSGGTANCVHYAQKSKQIIIHQLWADWTIFKAQSGIGDELLQTMAEVGLTSSHAEARRLIQGKGPRRIREDIATIRSRNG